MILKLKEIILLPWKSYYFFKDVEIEKALVSKKITSGEKNNRYYIDYLYSDHKVKPLQIMLLKSSA